MVYYDSELDSYESYYHYEADGRLDDDAQALVYGEGTEQFQGHGAEEVFPALGHAFSGAFGSALSNLVTYPLNVVTTRMQVRQQMERELEDRMYRRTGRDRKAGGSGASTPRRRTPSEFRAERLERIELGSHEQIEVTEFWSSESTHTGSYEGLWDTVESIYQDSGWRGFYAGLGWDTLSTVSAGFWYFAAYNFIRQHRLKLLSLPHAKGHKHPSIPILEELAMGIAAGAVAKFVASPLSTIVTRKQTSAMLHPHSKAPGIFGIMKDIVRENGFRGFWAGYEASLLLTVNPSITFLLYESAKTWISGRRRGAKLQTKEMFLLAAVCKALATAVTYPLSVARARAQVADRPRRSKNRKRKGGVLETLSDIVKTDGIGALWQGVEAEIIRGFFTHGLTMLIKEGVHRAIIKLYFFVLRAYNETTDGTLKQTAHQMVKDGYENASPRQKMLMEKIPQVGNLKKTTSEEEDEKLRVTERPRSPSRDRPPPSRIPISERRHSESISSRSRPGSVQGEAPVVAAAASSPASGQNSLVRARSNSIRSTMSSQRGFDAADRQLQRRHTTHTSNTHNNGPPSYAGSVAGSSRNGDGRAARPLVSPTPWRPASSPTASSPRRSFPIAGASVAPVPERIDSWRQGVTSQTVPSQDLARTTPAGPSPGITRRSTTSFTAGPQPQNDNMVRERRNISTVTETMKGRGPIRRQIDSDILSQRSHFSTARASDRDSLLVHPPSSEARFPTSSSSSASAFPSTSAFPTSAAAAGAISSRAAIRASPTGPPNTPRMQNRDLVVVPANIALDPSNAGVPPQRQELGMREELEWRRGYDRAATVIGGGHVGIGGAVQGERWPEDERVGRGWK